MYQMNMSPLVESLQNRFAAVKIDNARRVAEELAAHVLGCRPLEIYLRNEALTQENFRSLEELSGRIENGEPLQYVVGHVDFRGLKIKCDPRALIPRPETELLVEEVLNSGIWEKDSAAVIDVGTGTGCIILALAQKHPEAGFLAIDRSPAALELARENAHFHGLENKVQWRQNHLLDGVAPGSFDGVVANLPYIATNDWERLSPAVRDHEPQSALDSGPSGMELIEELAAQARTVLVPDGRLFLEFGYDQGDAVSRALKQAGYRNVRIKQDLAGLDRIAIATNPPC
jgi:release factor glutamine methyltransferase